MAVAHMPAPPLMIAAARPFDVAVLVLGAVLVVRALVSGIARRSLLSLTALFVLIGFVLGPGATGISTFRRAGRSSLIWPWWP